MKKQRKNSANLLARECMVTALIQLLKTKSLSAISISELTEKAGVSRMAYYRNYETKEDIFISYLRDALDEYRRDAESLPPDRKFFDTGNLIHCFSYFKKHNEFLETLFRSGLGHLLLNAISQYVLDTYQKPEDSIEHYYILQAFTGALYNLYIAWSLNGGKESPEEMAEILHRAYSL